jgi:hypothetical protein
MYCQFSEKFSRPTPSFEEAPPNIVEKICLVFVGALIELNLESVRHSDGQKNTYARQKIDIPPNQGIIYAGKNSQMAAASKAQPNLIIRLRLAFTSKWRF